ncbi:phage portal protein [Kutzneria kofuensis]|uniref:phage portal protein n=1 Tax=Kutzneria kofuensis TaxID=103725 RepID=UPI0031F0A9BA
MRAHGAQIPDLDVLDAYHEGQQPLSYMHPELLQRLDQRVRQVVINWPELVVDSLDERLDLTGFRMGGKDEADKELWRIWQANRLDLYAQQAHVDALVMGRAFAAVGTNENDARTPLVTVESPLEVHVELDPRTRILRAALKRWREDDSGTVIGLAPTNATLYLPNRCAQPTRATATEDLAMRHTPRAIRGRRGRAEHHPPVPQPDIDHEHALPCARRPRRGQAARNALMHLGDRSASVTCCDWDSRFTSACEAVFTAEGSRMPGSPPQAPRADALCERMIGTLRRELLDRLLIAKADHDAESNCRAPYAVSVCGDSRQ